MSDNEYGAPRTPKREVIVGGFIADMKRVGMATHNDQEAKRAQLLDASSDTLRLLESLIRSY